MLCNYHLSVQAQCIENQTNIRNFLVLLYVFNNFHSRWMPNIKLHCVRRTYNFHSPSKFLGRNWVFFITLPKIDCHVKANPIHSVYPAIGAKYFPMLYNFCIHSYILRIYFYSQLEFLLTTFELLQFDAFFFGFFSRIIHCILFGMQFHFPLTAEFAIRLIYHLFMSSDKFNLIAWMQNIEVVGGKCICCIPHFKCNFWNGQWQKFFTIFSRFPFPF